MKLFLYAIAILSFSASCTKDKAVPSPVNDENLFKLVLDTSGAFYYQSGNTLPSAGNSPHGNFKLRFNQKAKSVLNSMDELPVNGVFPDSSLIVKQIFSGTGIALYAVMFKRNGAWLWAEYQPNGNVINTIGNNGAPCVPCHTQSAHRDQVRTFDLH